MKKNVWLLLLTLVFSHYFLLVSPQTAYAMHIMEGFLPVGWALFWWVLTIPFLFLGLRAIRSKLKQNPQLKLILALSGAFAFVLSALKLPSVTGSSSHPTGLGLGTILFGPAVMSVLGFIVLLFQALLLAHGGLTTLGANAFSMAVVGPFIAYILFRGVSKMGLSLPVAVFLAAVFANLGTYVMTSAQLALAFPAEIGGFLTSFVTFLSIFAVTQIPLAISEGLLTVIVINLLSKYNVQELKLLRLPLKETP